MDLSLLSHLDIDAHVVRQLGDELITDPEQALLELVKNSFDADSAWCNIIIDTQYCCDLADLFPQREKQSKEKAPVVRSYGRIAIEDSGCGMNIDAVQKGWLTISLSPKRAFKKAGLTTPIYHRTPLGDKGLGRLGTMKLGDYLRISTFHDKKANGIRVTFNWNDCRSGVPLSQVRVDREELPASGKIGTVIEIFGLRDAGYWSGESRMNEFRMKLSTLISPFKTFDSFTIALTCNNRRIELACLPEDFMQTAMSHFELLWDDKKLELSAEVKLDLFRTQRSSELIETTIKEDQGVELFEFISKHPRCAGLNLKRSKSKKWFLEFSDEINWTELARPQKTDLPTNKPGEFVGEIYSFDLGNDSRELPDITSDLGEYRELVKQMAGIFIFRDNFRVRAGSDWLRLGESWTSGGSYYGLKPSNTIGYMAISSKDNPGLVEKSDREGFVDSAEWRGFYALCERLKKFANDALENLRRTAVDYGSLVEKRAARVPEKFTAEQGARDLGRLLETAKRVSTQLKKSGAERSLLLKKARETIKESAANPQLDRKLKAEVGSALEAVDTLVSQLSEETEQVQAILIELSDKQKYSDLIVDRFDQLKTQVDEVYDMVAIGLSAQGLVHEVHPLIDEVHGRVQSVKARLKKSDFSDQAVLSDLETIKSINTLISRRIAFLNPMLRTFREVKSNLSIRKFLTDYFDIRADRHGRSDVKSFVTGGDMAIAMNIGRLTQVVDNLVRNSEYWLENAKRHTREQLEIHAEIASPILTFWDTGPGVRRGVEETIFQIFVTDKPRGEGHGLGLFIVSQLLASQGCSIELSKARNALGNRYKFVIDFSGAIK